MVPPPLAITRRSDIDALRVIACAGVVLLHATLIYGPEPLYHLKAGTDSRAAGLIAEALRITTMPLFFLLAGWSAVGALRRRDARAFLRERLRRLLVPLVAGTVLLCPFIKYIELRGGRDMRPAGFRLVPPLQDDFLVFLPKFFGRVAMTTWSHLWFLAYLLLISVLLLPLLLHLARRAPVEKLPGVTWVFLPGIGLALLVAAVDGYWPYYPSLYRDWGNVLYYGVCFALGAGLAAWPGWEVRLRQVWPVLLTVAALAFAAVAWLGETSAGRLAVGMTAWCAAMGAIGLVGGRRFGPWASVLGPAAMPVYVLHHLVLLLLALVALRSGAPWWVQAPLIWLGTLAVSAGLWWFLVRPWGLTRLLFGALPPRSLQHRT